MKHKICWKSCSGGVVLEFSDGGVIESSSGEVRCSTDEVLTQSSIAQYCMYDTAQFSFYCC